ncbi:hypothetical protein EG327_003021 [Venturia inaequalis]|uniref:Uncharacterized protein n=1 Tax=Venturia inaequalis TaxID=5025 RepID=A0A8H3VQP0_VENIN|nr:hypothetical protein EG327_003021 [Venturia inaequalis]
MDLNYSAYQQSNLHRFGNGASNGGPAAATLLMQQREQLHQGAYSQGTPTTSSHTQFAQAPSSNTITPPRNFGPYTPSSANTSRSPSLSGGLPQSQHPYSSSNSSMAAQTMTSNPQLGGMQSPSKPAGIQSPSLESTSRDQERVTLLLEINQLLLQEIVTLQEAGKGGDVQSPAKTGEGTKEEGKSVASQEYVDCMRRMQSNLAYLANVAERASRPTQAQMPWPPLMSVPTTGPSQLPEMYVKLQNMFPAWKTHQAQQKTVGGGGGGNLSPGSGVGTPGGQ